MGLEMLFLWLVYFCLYEDYNSESINSDTKLEMFNTKSNMQDYFELLFHINGQIVLDEEVEASSCQKEN